MLTCTKCKTEKDDAEFYVSRGNVRRNGRTYWCKPCYANHYEVNKERLRAAADYLEADTALI